jgi:hypothetical protein
MKRITDRNLMQNDVSLFLTLFCTIWCRNRVFQWKTRNLIPAQCAIAYKKVSNQSNQLHFYGRNDYTNGSLRQAMFAKSALEFWSKQSMFRVSWWSAIVVQNPIAYIEEPIINAL